MRIFLLLTFFILVTIPYGYSDNAVAIDFGSNVRVALVKRGSPMDIVLNTESKRSTVSAVAIDKYERIFGGSALHWLTKYPEKSFVNLASLLGRRIDSLEVIEYQKLHPSVTLVEDKGRPSGIAIKHPDHEQPFTIEELVSFILGYIKEIAEKAANEPVNEVVIAISPHYDQFARVALLQAAELAGLKVHELVHDITAAALQFSISLTNLTKDSKCYLFYDIGATSSSTSIVCYNLRSTTNSHGENVTVPFVDVVATKSLSNLGGITIDLIIRDRFIDMFESANPSLKGALTNKAMIRLLNEANRVKSILTVNSDIEVKLESLVDEIDFRTRVTKTDLENWCESSRSLFLEPVHSVLQNANMSLENIEGLVLIGSGSRVPRIMEDIKKFVGEAKVIQTINIDEAVAMGACVLAAALSKKFGVKDIRVIDRLGMSTFISDEKSNFVPLFPHATPHGSKKHITMKKLVDFEFQFLNSYSPNEKMITMGTARVTGVESALMKTQNSSLNLLEEPKVKITAQLSNSRIISFDKAALVYSYQERLQGPANNTESAPSASSPTSQLPLSPDDLALKMVNRTDSIALKVESIFQLPMLKDDQIRVALKRSQEMRQFYILKKSKGEARNALESYAYDLRSRLKNPEFLKYLKSDLKDLVHETLGRVLAKVEEDIDQFTIEEYRSDLMSLKELINPAELRLKNDRELPDTISSFYSTTNQTMKFVDKVRNISTEDVSVAELDKLVQMVREVTTWLETANEKQISLPLYELPALSVSEIKKRTTGIESEKTRLSNKFYAKKPKLEKPLKAENNSDSYFSSEMKEKLQKMMEELKKDGKLNLTNLMNDTANFPFPPLVNETETPPLSSLNETMEPVKEHLEL